MNYKITATVETITNSTTLTQDKKYGGWMAVNQGTNTATVMGYELQPGEGISMIEAVPPGSIWDIPIRIVCQPGAAVRVTRLQAMPIK